MKQAVGVAFAEEQLMWYSVTSKYYSFIVRLSNSKWLYLNFVYLSDMLKGASRSSHAGEIVRK